MRKIITIAAAVVLLVSLGAAAIRPIRKIGIVEATTDPEGNAVVTVGAVTETLDVLFSVENHFHSEQPMLSLSNPWQDTQIYYTLDGSEPTRESVLYEEPIVLTVLRSPCVVVKAVTYAGETRGQTVTRSYFIDGNIATRFDTLVFSLSTDKKNLYDYDYGIFVPGRLRQEYIDEFGSRDLDPTKPANFNLRGMEGERPVYVECFTPDGQRVVAQNAGLRVHGGWSRDAAQKSIKLIARKSYEPSAGMFRYDFFPDDTADDPYGTPIVSYDTIVLRNGANDRNFGMVRNEVASKLASDWGFPNVTPTRPAAVFINGNYYGFAMIQVSLEEHYLEDTFNAPTDSFDIIGNGEEWYDSEEVIPVSDLQALRNLADLDLTSDANYQQVTEVLDVDNMLRYYAFQIYMGNNDWPNNNLKRWRYTGDKSIKGLHPWLDGRWRYLMYDLDWTLGLYTGEVNQPTFQYVLGGEKNVPLLVALLKRPELAERFTNLLCDLTAYLTPTRVGIAIDTIYDAAIKEISAALNMGLYDNWVGYGSIEDNHRYMKYYAAERPAYILNSLCNYFGYTRGDMYTVETGEHVRIGSQDTQKGSYFRGLSVTLTARPPKGKLVDHWLVNGVRHDEPSETLVLSDKDAPGGVVWAEVVLKDAPAGLRLISCEYAPEWNGCVLENTSGTAILLQGHYLSDNQNQLRRWAFPGIELAAGETLTLSGSQYSDETALHTVPLNFNCQVGESVILSDENGEVIDWIVVTAMDN